MIVHTKRQVDITFLAGFANVSAGNHVLCSQFEASATSEIPLLKF